jgi:hypothetical protein
MPPEMFAAGLSSRVKICTNLREVSSQRQAFRVCLASSEILQALTIQRLSKRFEIHVLGSKPFQLKVRELRKHDWITDTFGRQVTGNWNIFNYVAHS